MTKKTNYLFLKLLKETVLFTIILFALHKYFQHFFFKEVFLFHPIYTIYLFLMISFIGIFYFIIKAYVSKPDAILTTFLIGSLAKSGVAILFFIPVLFNKPENLNITVFGFFIPYFLFLFFEIYQIIRVFKTLK